VLIIQDPVACTLARKRDYVVGAWCGYLPSTEAGKATTDQYRLEKQAYTWNLVCYHSAVIKGVNTERIVVRERLGFLQGVLLLDDLTEVERSRPRGEDFFFNDGSDYGRHSVGAVMDTLGIGPERVKLGYVDRVKNWFELKF
jgi:hypothetical protein